MKPAKYKFYLDDTEVYPVYKNLTLKLSKSDGNMFFRNSLEGDLYLYNIDLSFNKKYTFLIKEYIEGQWQDLFKGEFTKADCEVDYNRGYVKLKISNTDDYDNIINNQENTYNLAKLPIKTESVTIDKRPMLQIYIPGANTVGCFLAGIWFEQECTAVDNDKELTNNYHFGKSSKNYKYVELSGDGVIQNEPIQYKGSYIGVLESRTEDNSVGHFNYQTGRFTSVYSYKYVLDIEFVKFTHFTDPVQNYKKSTYKLVDRVSGFTMFETSFYIQDEKAWENDTFTMNSANAVASGTLEGALYTRYIYGRIVCSKNTYNGEPTKEIPYEDIVTSNRNYTRCIPWADNYMVDISSRTSTQATEWGRSNNDTYYLPPDDEHVYYPVSRSIWGDISFWHIATYSMNVVEKELTYTYTMKNAYNLASCIKQLLIEMGSTIEHEETTEYSEFLYGDKNPIIDEAFKVMITQKTNILKGEYDQPAQKAEITFKNLMSMLQQCFMCYWFVEGGKLKIEHISWFINGGKYGQDNEIGIDLTKLLDIRNSRELAYGQSQISYSKDEMPGRYEFKWNDSCSLAFDGKPINVNAEFVQKDKVESINSSDFASDVDLMLLNPSDFSEDGFALLGAVKENGAFKLPYVDFMLTEKTPTMTLGYNASAQNGYMSWCFLEIFYLWNMPSTNIEIEGVIRVNDKSEYYVRSVTRCMKQTVKFPYNKYIDTTKLIKTFIGDGQIDSISTDLNIKQVSVNLVFEPK